MDTGIQLITEPKAAELIGRPASTLRHWRWGTTGPEDFHTGIHVGIRVMYDAKAIEEWLSAQFAKAEKERARRREEAST